MNALVDIVLDLLRGRRDHDDISAKNIAVVIAEQLAEPVLELVKTELAKYFATVGIILAADELDDAARAVIERWRASESRPGIVARALDGVEIEQMPADWHPEDP